MKKSLLLLMTGVGLTFSALAQKDTTQVIDNKGAYKVVID